eukprot:m.563384 g.563384  ORF g.563384 m.563384 type:complete len:289 (-) comp22230_c1_seq2:496-1362(-)
MGFVDSVIALLAFIVVTADAQCTYTDGSTSKDFSSLTQQTYFSINSVQYNSYRFFFNLCAPISFSDPSNPDVCPDGSTGSCEIQVLSEGALIASEAYGSGTGSWSKHNGDHGIAPGPVWTMTGGPCTRESGNTVTSKIYLECDETAISPNPAMIEDNYWECFMYAKIYTNLACFGNAPGPSPFPAPPSPGPPPAPPGAPTRSSPSTGDKDEEAKDIGMILSIVFFVCVFMYLAVGAVYLHKKGSEGWDRVPNREFWTAMPGLISDGFSFTKEKIKDWYNSRRGYTSAS